MRYLLFTLQCLWRAFANSVSHRNLRIKLENSITLITRSTIPQAATSCVSRMYPSMVIGFAVSDVSLARVQGCNRLAEGLGQHYINIFG